MTEKIDEYKSEESESANDAINHSSFNNYYDWGNRINDEIILDECKRKTMKHHSKTNIYEYYQNYRPLHAVLAARIKIGTFDPYAMLTVQKTVVNF